MPPPRIIAPIKRIALGDFLADVMFASAVRAFFDDAQFDIYYRNNRPYMNDILRCVPNLNRAIEGSEAQVAGRDVGEVGPRDVLLDNTLFSDEQMLGIPVPTLRPPPDMQQRGTEALIRMGIDPSRWLAIVYWKEAGYEFRGYHGARIVKDPTPYLAASRFIVENLGGQVVRIGHPTETVMPQIPGILDLSKVPDSHWLQMYAASVSRFIIATNSGPSMYGVAFDVPTALMDCIEIAGVWRDHHYLVTRGFHVGGKEYRQMEAYEAGHLDHGADWAEYGTQIPLRPNSIGEMFEAVDEMYALSADCTGWRTVGPGDVVSPKSNAITLPVRAPRWPGCLIPPSKRTTHLKRTWPPT